MQRTRSRVRRPISRRERDRKANNVVCGIMALCGVITTGVGVVFFGLVTQSSLVGAAAGDALGFAMLITLAGCAMLAASAFGLEA